MPPLTLAKKSSPAARAFQAAKAKYGKPRKKMRKHSLQPLPRLKKKADRQLQDWYRATNPGVKCDVCYRPYEIMHHVVEKSQSAGLRFEPVNLVFLCQSCHAKHHLGGDPEILATLIRKYGMYWFEELMRLKVERKGTQLNRKYLEEHLARFSSIE